MYYSQSCCVFSSYSKKPKQKVTVSMIQQQSIEQPPCNDYCDPHPSLRRILATPSRSKILATSSLRCTIVLHWVPPASFTAVYLSPTLLCTHPSLCSTWLLHYGGHSSLFVVHTLSSLQCTLWPTCLHFLLLYTLVLLCSFRACAVHAPFMSISMCTFPSLRPTHLLHREASFSCGLVPSSLCCAYSNSS